MKKFYLLMILLCGVFAFSACSKDDENEESEIVGKWTMTTDYYLDVDGKKVAVDTYKDGEDVYYFNADGSGKNVYKGEDGEEVDNFTYTYDAGKGTLKVTFKQDDKTYTMSYKVSVSGSKAVVTAAEADNDGETYVMELKKI